MAILYFSDVLKKVGLESAKVKLIRHALTDKGFRSCYDKNMVLESTRHQKSGLTRTMIIGVCLSAAKERLQSCLRAIRLETRFQIHRMLCQKTSRIRNGSRAKMLILI